MPPIDFQHREGSKIGSGGQLSGEQSALERKERLRRLALETIDISKDPYFMRNHLGTFECKLCLTLHGTEGNYLAHTQGKRHQENLGRRAAMEAKAAAAVPKTAAPVAKRRVMKIGRPGYKVTKSRDLHTRQRSLTFEIDFPEAESDCQPRSRFMSAYEQKVEPADKNYQYLLFACDPYETVAFKIPNLVSSRIGHRHNSPLDALSLSPRRHKQGRGILLSAIFNPFRASLHASVVFPWLHSQHIVQRDIFNLLPIILTLLLVPSFSFFITIQPIDKREGRFFSRWHSDSKKFVLQLFFQEPHKE